MVIAGTGVVAAAAIVVVVVADDAVAVVAVSHVGVAAAAVVVVVTGGVVAPAGATAVAGAGSHLTQCAGFHAPTPTSTAATTRRGRRTGQGGGGHVAAAVAGAAARTGCMVVWVMVVVVMWVPHAWRMRQAGCRGRTVVITCRVATHHPARPRVPEVVLGAAVPGVHASVARVPGQTSTTSTTAATDAAVVSWVEAVVRQPGPWAVAGRDGIDEVGTHICL